MTTTCRISSVTVQVGDDHDVYPQTESSDSIGPTTEVSVFADLGSTTVQLAGTADALRSFAQAVIDAATTVEQRQLAKGVVVGF